MFSDVANLYFTGNWFQLRKQKNQKSIWTSKYDKKIRHAQIHILEPKIKGLRDWQRQNKRNNNNLNHQNNL